MASESAKGMGTQAFYLLAVIIVGCLMTAGLGAFLSPKLGTFLGYIFGLLIAIVIEGVFTLSLRQWRTDRSAEMLFIALIFGGISVLCDAPVIFSVARGGGLTAQEFVASRDLMVRDITLALGRLRAAKAGADGLNAYSASKQKEEQDIGGTCNILGGHQGERYRFRKRDAENFSMQAQALSGFVEQLAGTLKDVEAMSPPATDAALQDALRKLNEDLSAASAAAHDTSLADISRQFAVRSTSDGAEQQDPITHVRFVCSDATIAARTKAIASQIEGMPALDQHIVVPNMSDISTTMVELPRRLVVTMHAGIGGKDALSGDDLSALIISCLFEIMLVGATLATQGRSSAGRRLFAAEHRARGLKDTDLTAVLAVSREPPPEIAFLIGEIERYRKLAWPLELIVVAHGCDEIGLKRLAEAMPIFCTLGLAKRHRVIPQWMLRHWVRQRTRRDGTDRRSLSALIRRALMLPPPRRRPWPADMLDAARLEVFRLDIKTVDEIRVAALLHSHRPPTEPTDGDAPADGGSWIVPSLPIKGVAEPPPNFAAE